MIDVAVMLRELAEDLHHDLTQQREMLAEVHPGFEPSLLRTSDGMFILTAPMAALGNVLAALAMLEAQQRQSDRKIIGYEIHNLPGREGTEIIHPSDVTVIRERPNHG